MIAVGLYARVGYHPRFLRKIGISPLDPTIPARRGEVVDCFADWLVVEWDDGQRETIPAEDVCRAEALEPAAPDA